MTLHVPRLPFSLDPLMAEAKRRARQRRALVALAVVVAAATGAGLGLELRGTGSATPVPSTLTILAVGEQGGRALFHLRCDPAGGNVAHPAEACAAIAAQPSLVTNPKPFFDWGPNAWYFTITGRLNGKPVHFGGESSWTTQFELIDRLGLAGAHGRPLRPEALRRGSVGLGQTRTFAPGVLRPGDLVACRVHRGTRSPAPAMAVPVHRGVAGYVGATPGVLGVRVRADGAIVASCLARNSLPLDKRGRTTLPHGWPP